MASASPVRMTQGSRLLRTIYPTASAQGLKVWAELPVSLTRKGLQPLNCRQSRSGNFNGTRAGFELYVNAVATMVLMPIDIVITPTAPCSPPLAQVSQRAETASGTAITADSAPIPTIEPTPNSAT